MKEAANRRKIMKKLLETEGGFWFHPHGNPYTTAGIPDIIGCLNGCYIAFEVKRPTGGNATIKQQWTLDRITEEGGVSAVIRYAPGRRPSRRYSPLVPTVAQSYSLSLIVLVTLTRISLTGTSPRRTWP